MVFPASLSALSLAQSLRHPDKMATRGTEEDVDDEPEDDEPEDDPP